MPIDFAAPAGEATVTVTVTVVDLEETSFVADRDAPGMPGYGCRCGQGCCFQLDHLRGCRWIKP